MEETRAPQAPAKRGGPPVLLLVDDDELILSSMQRLLHRTFPGIDVVVAPHGEAGLEVVRGGAVDLIVSDYRMPGINGVELLRACQDLAPSAVRILWTAYETPEIAAQARSVGANLVSKGLDPLDLVHAIRHAWQVVEA